MEGFTACWRERVSLPNLLTDKHDYFNADKYRKIPFNKLLLGGIQPQKLSRQVAERFATNARRE